jgi:hypothetical protein
MKLLRLFQPRNPLFWLMLATNAASSLLIWLVTAYSVTTGARLLITLFALGNLFIGMWCLRRLWRGSGNPPVPDA